MNKRDLEAPDGKTLRPLQKLEAVWGAERDRLTAEIMKSSVESGISDREVLAAAAIERLEREEAMFETSPVDVYEQALRLIVSLPPTRTGLGLEEAQTYAQRALAHGRG